MEKMSADYQKLQEYSKQQKVQLDSQVDRIRILESDLKHNTDHRTKASVPTNTPSTAPGDYCIGRQNGLSKNYILLNLLVLRLLRPMFPKDKSDTGTSEQYHLES